MADIKVDLSSGQRIANPFKTTRKSTTNPFKYSNFEGNTLQFADVFEGFKPTFKGATAKDKLKIISASVAGSMTKLHSSIIEPIVNFVGRITTGVANAWNYAKNTNISDITGLKGLSENISNTMNTDIADIGKNIGESISNLSKGLSEKMSFLNTDITDIGKGLSTAWTDLVGKISPKKITADMPVAELRAMWENEIALASMKEVA